MHVFWIHNNVITNPMASLFLALKETCTIFHSDCNNVHFHQRCMGVPCFPYLCQHVCSQSFEKQPIWKGWGSISSELCCVFPWWLVVLNVYIFFAICFSPFDNCFLRSSAHFLTWLFYCCCCWEFWVTDTFCIVSLCQIASPCSPSVKCLFALLIVYFDV